MVRCRRRRGGANKKKKRERKNRGRGKKTSEPAAAPANSSFSPPSLSQHSTRLQRHRERRHELADKELARVSRKTQTRREKTPRHDFGGHASSSFPISSLAHRGRLPPHSSLFHPLDRRARLGDRDGLFPHQQVRLDAAGQRAFVSFRVFFFESKARG